MKFTLIYEPHHGDTSVFGPVLASHFPTTTHAGSRATTHKVHHFVSAYNCQIRPAYLMWVSRPPLGGWIIYFACIWHINSSRLACSPYVVNYSHHNSHTTLLTSVREPPQFACLCRTDSCASVTIYPVHVLVCLRATCSIHAAWMTFGPLSTILTWGTACATKIS